MKILPFIKAKVFRELFPLSIQRSTKRFRAKILLIKVPLTLPLSLLMEQKTNLALGQMLF
jgi:hypothetical protein